MPKFWFKKSNEYISKTSDNLPENEEKSLKSYLYLHFVIGKSKAKSHIITKTVGLIAKKRTFFRTKVLTRLIYIFNKYNIYMKQLAAYRSPPRVPVPLTRTGFSKIVVKSWTLYGGFRIGFPMNLYKKTL